MKYNDFKHATIIQTEELMIRIWEKEKPTDQDFGESLEWWKKHEYKEYHIKNSFKGDFIELAKEQYKCLNGWPKPFWEYIADTGISIDAELVEIKPDYSPLSNQANAFEDTKYHAVLTKKVE